MSLQKHLLLRLVIYLVIPGFLFSCKNSKVTQTNSTIQLSAPGPDECRLKAQILEVFPPKIQEASKSLCTRFSCEAKVKILEVKSTGHTFPNDISIGSEIRVRFSKTLAPGKEAYPNSPNPLPGLKEGDIFESVLLATEKLGVGQSFQTSEYIKIQ